MCKNQAEGGQRCASHTREPYLKATFGDANWDEVARNYASTPEGATVIEAAAQAAVTGSPDDEARLRTALRRGQALRDANKTVGVILRTPKTPTTPVPVAEPVGAEPGDGAGPFASRAEFDAAVVDASYAAQGYYDSDDLTMTDAEYDALVDQIDAARAIHPDWDDHGVTTAVAGGASAGGDVTHPAPMLSLSKAKTDAEITAFMNRLNGPASVEVKLDGLAIRAEYVNGQLVLAATRGDGATGEDVTTQATRFDGINGLPETLPNDFTGEVRGEVFMTDDDFMEANENRVGAGGKAFVNPRNATAGSLRKADREYATPMSFAAYDITGDTIDEDSYEDRMSHADTLGFTTAQTLTPATTLVANAEEALAAIRTIEEHRASLGYPIDGAVIKADSNTDRDRLGEASRTPRWATSFKYAPDAGTSHILAIETAIGRTGRLSLRARITPTFVGGTLIEYASLHNVGWTEAAGLTVGSKVAVVRAGDVIPRVTAAIGDQPDGLTAWKPPRTCPQCGVEWDKASSLWRCQTPSCSTVGRVAYMAGRDNADVDGLSEATSEALVEAGLVNNIADLFDLTVSQVAAVKIGTTSSGADRLIGTTTAAKIVNGIEASKTQPLNRWISSLGLRHTGRSLSRSLASSFKSMDALRAATVEDLAQIDKIGPVKAAKIVEGLASMSDTIDRLVASGITTKTATVAVPAGTVRPFEGKSVVISGAVPNYTRTTAQEAVEAAGGNASSSVSKNTSFLVTDETETSKAKKAAALGIPIITPAEFAAMLNG